MLCIIFLQENVSLCNSCRRAILKPPIVAWTGRGAAFNIAATRAAAALAVPLAGAPVRFRRKAAAHCGAGLGRRWRQWRYRQRTPLICFRKFCGLLIMLSQGFCCHDEWKLVPLLISYTVSRGLQRDDVSLGWPIASSYMSPNAGEGGELRANEYVQLYTGAQRNFGDLAPYLTYDCIWLATYQFLYSTIRKQNRLGGENTRLRRH
jgi:hypothetical protein